MILLILRRLFFQLMCNFQQPMISIVDYNNDSFKDVLIGGNLYRVKLRWVSMMLKWVSPDRR